VAFADFKAAALRAKWAFRRRFFILSLLLCILALFAAGPVFADGVALIKVDMAIGPIANKVISDALSRAIQEDCRLLIIELDTPGGLDKSMRAICRELLNSDIPTVVYVAPSGARAASAGVFITYAANIAAMAPGTNIGAAHSVSMGGQIDSIMERKIQNDAVAYLTSIAKKRGRSIGFARRAVLESESVDAEVALDSNIIDVMADNVDSLLTKIDGRVVDLPTGPDTLHVAGANVVEYSMGFKDRFLNIITDPNIAFILFNLGWLGLLIELYSPGLIFPGVIGGISLILAFFSFQQLPINYAGLGLIIFAVILFVLEVKVTSYGILAVGGVISMLLGSLMLIDSPAPYLQISLTVIVATVAFAAAFFLVIIGFVIKTHRKKVVTGMEGLVDAIGEVRQGGLVFVHGELWRADCDRKLEPGDRVKVLSVGDMRLKVEKLGA
jgi:membrane-bound serine protease (ClpP class)